MDYLISIIFGWVASFLQGERGKHLGKLQRYLVSFASCLLVALAVTGWKLFSEGTFDLEQSFVYLSTAFMTSQTFYMSYFKTKT